VLDQVRRELGEGRKRGHWMWFVFPQLRGLGRSTTAQRYGIGSLDEAGACLEHPVLGPRLVDECTGLINRVVGRSVHEIHGAPDGLKLHSSMTLFASAGPEALAFREALGKHFGGASDALSVERLQHPQVIPRRSWRPGPVRPQPLWKGSGSAH
jgi:uncharacterized protein (DUF1810 family)